MRLNATVMMLTFAAITAAAFGGLGCQHQTFGFGGTCSVPWRVTLLVYTGVGAVIWLAYGLIVASTFAKTNVCS